MHQRFKKVPQLLHAVRLIHAPELQGAAITPVRQPIIQSRVWLKGAAHPVQDILHQSLQVTTGLTVRAQHTTEVQVAGHPEVTAHQAPLQDQDQATAHLHEAAVVEVTEVVAAVAVTEAAVQAPAVVQEVLAVLHVVLHLHPQEEEGSLM